MRRTLQFKQKNAELLDGLTPDRVKAVIDKTDVVNVLVDRDQKGRRILMVKSGSKSSEYSCIKIFEHEEVRANSKKPRIRLYKAKKG